MKRHYQSHELQENNTNNDNKTILALLLNHSGTCTNRKPIINKMKKNHHTSLCCCSCCCVITFPVVIYCILSVVAVAAAAAAEQAIHTSYMKRREREIFHTFPASANWLMFWLVGIYFNIVFQFHITWWWWWWWSNRANHFSITKASSFVFHEFWLQLHTLNIPLCWITHTHTHT